MLAGISSVPEIRLPLQESSKGVPDGSYLIVPRSGGIGNRSSLHLMTSKQLTDLSIPSLFILSLRHPHSLSAA